MLSCRRARLVAGVGRDEASWRLALRTRTAPASAQTMVALGGAIYAGGKHNVYHSADTVLLQPVGITLWI